MGSLSSASPSRDGLPAIEDSDLGIQTSSNHVAAKPRSLSKASEAGMLSSPTVLRNTYVDYDMEDKESGSALDKSKVCRSIGFHVKVLWSCLSVMVTVGCSFSLLQPHWFTHFTTRDSLGLYSYCVTDAQTASEQQVCDVYGGYFRLQHLPSNAWQVSCLLYGMGCLLLALSSLSSLMTLVLNDRWADRIAIYTGYSQTLAVVLLIVSLVVFPVGLDCSFVRHHCGPESHAYDAGNCHVGWAYVLAIMSTALAMFCPVLSQYTDFRESYYDSSSTEYL